MSLIEKALKQAEKERRSHTENKEFIPLTGARKSAKKVLAGKKLIIIGGASVLSITFLIYFFWAPSQKTGSLLEAKPVHQARLVPETPINSSPPLIKEKSGSKETELRLEKNDLPKNSGLGELKPEKVDNSLKKPENKLPSPQKSAFQKPSLVADSTRVELSEDEEIKTPGAEEKSLPEKHYNLAVAYFREDRLKKAIEEYEKAIALDPFCVEAYNNKGVIYQKLGMLDLAIKEYQEALSIDRKNEKVLNNLGIAFYLKGSLKRAKSCYQRSLQVNPQNLASYNNLGIAFQKANQMEEAEAIFRKALAIDSHHGETHYNLALLYERKGEIINAIFHYKQFLKSSSKNYPLKKKVESRLTSFSHLQIPE